MAEIREEMEKVTERLRGFPVAAMLPRVYIMTSLIIPKARKPKPPGKKKRAEEREEPSDEEE